MYQVGYFCYPVQPWPLYYRGSQTPVRAYAEIKGGPLAPNIHGFVVFTDMGMEPMCLLR